MRPGISGVGPLSGCLCLFGGLEKGGWQPFLDDDPAVIILNGAYDAGVPTVRSVAPLEKEGRDAAVGPDDPAVLEWRHRRGGSGLLLDVGACDALGHGAVAAAFVHAARHGPSLPPIERAFDEGAPRPTTGVMGGVRADASRT